MINDDIIEVVLKAYQYPKGDSFHEIYEHALVPFSPKIAYDVTRSNDILELMIYKGLLIDNGHPWYKLSGEAIEILESYKSSSGSSSGEGLLKKRAVYIPPIIATPIIKQILIGLFVTVIGGLILWWIIG